MYECTNVCMYMHACMYVHKHILYACFQHVNRYVSASLYDTVNVYTCMCKCTSLKILHIQSICSELNCDCGANYTNAQDATECLQACSQMHMSFKALSRHFLTILTSESLSRHSVVHILQLELRKHVPNLRAFAF